MHLLLNWSVLFLKLLTLSLLSCNISQDRYIEAFSRCRLSPTLTFSLINTVFSYDPVGWGIPYGHTLVADSAEAVVNSAVHLLIGILNYEVVTLIPFIFIFLVMKLTLTFSLRAHETD